MGDAGFIIGTLLGSAIIYTIIIIIEIMKTEATPRPDLVNEKERK